MTNLKLGHAEWHSSDEDSGPDVGIAIGLNNGAHLWVGELSSARWQEAGGDAMNLGKDSGSWIVLYPAYGDPTVIGRMNEELMHSEVGDLLFAALVAP